MVPQQIKTATSCIHHIIPKSSKHHLQTILLHCLPKWIIHIPRNPASPSLKWTIQKEIAIAKIINKLNIAWLQQRSEKTSTQSFARALSMRFYASRFSVPKAMKLNKLLIKLTKSTCNIHKSSPHILTQLPRKTFHIGELSLLPKSTTTLEEQLIQTLNDPSPLGKVHQGIVNINMHSIIHVHGCVSSCI